MSFQAEFPIDSDNWESLTPSVVGVNYTVDLSNHSGYPSEGLKGALDDGGNPNSRLIGVRYNMLTNCDFVAGSSFKMEANANNVCGSIAAGSGRKVSTTSINIDGITGKYNVTLNLSKQSGSFNNCEGQTVFKGDYLVNSTGAETGDNAYVEITLPFGYNYIPNSLIPVPGNHQVTFQSITTNSTGEEVMRLKVPAGMVSGNMLEYTFEVKESFSDYVPCGNKSIEVVAIDNVSDVLCSSAPEGKCPAVNIEVGKTNFDFSVEKPSVNIFTNTAVSATNGNNQDITANITVNNLHPTFDVSAGTTIQAYYDENQNGIVDGDDILLGSESITSSISAGSSLTTSLSFTAHQSQACNILLVASTDKNLCLCSESFVRMVEPTFCAFPLPVQLTSFHASCEKGRETVLSWTTASESNSLNFEVSKSLDLKSWELIDVISAKGNSNEMNVYSTIDKFASPDVTYYQLVQRDIDGKENTYSPISNVCDDLDLKGMSVYPNPTNGKFNVEFYSNSETTCQLQIIDVNGRQIIVQKHQLKKGKNTFILSKNPIC
ncbi:MAG TPA: T9SS type A sorting domain-containing protein [Brumimicrobium sp.]|nr:T9SS type A sorting domain-containing protein [Brumimicrobium sp.]